MFWKEKKACPVPLTPLGKAKAELSKFITVKSVEVEFDEYVFRVRGGGVDFYQKNGFKGDRFGHWDRYKTLVENYLAPVVFFTEHYEEIREKVKTTAEHDKRNDDIKRERERNQEAYEKRKLEECEIKLLEMIEDDGKG